MRAAIPHLDGASATAHFTPAPDVNGMWVAAEPVGASDAVEPAHFPGEQRSDAGLDCNLYGIWQSTAARELMAAQDIAGLYRLVQGHGYSQRRIARLTGQSQSEVNEIITKGRRVVSYAVLLRICEGLAIPRGWLGLAFQDADTLAEPPIPAGHTGVPRWTGPEIRRLRQCMRMSLRIFAQHLGVSARSVSKWEAGARPGPTNQAVLDTCHRLAEPDARARFRAASTSVRLER